MRLKQLRKEKKKLQREVAEVINCSQAVYSRYESGEREPSNDILSALADYYGVSVDYILGRDQEEPQVSPVVIPTVTTSGAAQEQSDAPKPAQRSAEAQAIIDEIMAKIMAIPDDAKIQVLNFADFIKAQEDAKK